MIPRIDYVSEVVIMMIDYTRNHNYSAATEGRAISYSIFRAPALLLASASSLTSRFSSIFLLNFLRFAYGTDGFLTGALVNMATLRALVIVPDKFIKRKVLATARVTHHASLHLAQYLNTDLFSA